MKTVGVRELKARLSEYLRDVRNGETYLVTDRGRVVAELRAPRAGVAELVQETGPLDRLMETGEVTAAALPKRDWVWQVKGLGLPAGTAAALLDEVRGEGSE